jgi:hypothetical protein
MITEIDILFQVHLAKPIDPPALIEAVVGLVSRRVVA